MNADHPPFLVVAVTGRALAASAVRGGHAVVVLDCFADRDTDSFARDCRAVAALGTIRLDRRALLAAAGALAPALHSAGLVVGAGFEGRTRLLTRLAEGRRLVGNPPDVIREVKSPRRFFPLLDRLGLRYPDVRLTPPSDPTGWLVKLAGGAGGTHVALAAGHARRRGDYWQRRMTGSPSSVLFLADGRRASVVGFNTQWTRSVGGSRPFVYGGAVSHLTLPPGTERDLRARLDALVAETGLVGLCGLDFLQDGEEWLALEVNPRPTATLDLHDPDFPRGLFDAHLRACAGELPPVDAAPRGAPARAQGIVPANDPWQVPDGFSFPSWCRDLPQVGQRFAPGDPVCTILAEAPEPVGAIALLRAREMDLGRLMAEALSAR